MRTFFAVELEPQTVERVSAVQRKLAELLPGVRWVRREHLHLTVLFLGEHSESEVLALGDRVPAVCRGIRPGRLRIAAAGCFPRRGPVRVLWLGIDDPSGTLAALHGGLVSAATGRGLATEERDFHPHLTLGRSKRGIGRRRVEEAYRSVGELDVEAAPVDTCALVESVLGAGGPRYRIVERWGLGVEGEVHA